MYTLYVWYGATYFFVHERLISPTGQHLGAVLRCGLENSTEK